jgi:hypothetical protein
MKALKLVMKNFPLVGLIILSLTFSLIGCAVIGNNEAISKQSNLRLLLKVRVACVPSMELNGS